MNIKTDKQMDLFIQTKKEKLYQELKYKINIFNY